MYAFMATASSCFSGIVLCVYGKLFTFFCICRSASQSNLQRGPSRRSPQNSPCWAEGTLTTPKTSLGTANYERSLVKKSAVWMLANVRPYPSPWNACSMAVMATSNSLATGILTFLRIDRFTCLCGLYRCAAYVMSLAPCHLVTLALPSKHIEN